MTRVSHEYFLKNLPKENKKKVLIKATLLLLIGFPLSILGVTLVIVLLGNSLISNQFDIRLLLAQDIPFVLLTMVLFYRVRIADLGRLIVPKVLNKSILLIIVILVVELLVSIILAIPSLQNESVLKWYHSLSSPDSISVDYLIQFSQLFLMYFVMAFCEEFVFRLTVFRFLRKSGLIFALIISSLLFSLSHGQLGISTFLSGIILALYYEYTNNYIGVVIIHALRNLLVVYYSYYFAGLIIGVK